jgi:hypothetical protein
MNELQLPPGTSPNGVVGKAADANSAARDIEVVQREVSRERKSCSGLGRYASDLGFERASRKAYDFRFGLDGYRTDDAFSHCRASADVVPDGA